MTANPLLVLLLAPWGLALLLPALGARWKARTGWVALLAPLLSLGATLMLLAQPPEARAALTWEWVPSLGVTLTFVPDGLALFYGLVVSGIGVLVTLYATFYLDDQHRDHGRFYAYLLLFMGAMLATVFSSNLLVLFVAWEITGLTSFLLIGFWHEHPGSQRGARMALLTTVLTGLALLAGVVLLRLIFGTYELPAILASGGAPAGQEPLLTAAFVCCFIGLAGKSAQFPFHYWLPNAMAAPTPVSAYLHSATMVKLGVFLSARLLPVFNGLDSWLPVLTLVGCGTLLLGAVLALLSQDLKGVLAYTTVAQLGLLVGYYGLHSRGVPVAWDYLHILNHALYKAALFMVVGIVDHSAGTRDLRQLGGLWSRLPLTGCCALVGLAALAGLPLTTGFLSKELLLAAVGTFYERSGGFLGIWVVATVVLASVIKTVVALGIWHRVFCGPLNPEVARRFHAPSWGLQLPPLVLALLVLAGGGAAAWFGRWTLGFGVPGEHILSAPDLHLWPGLTPELLTSLGILAAGGLLYFAVGRRRWARVHVPAALRADRAFDGLVDGLAAGGKKLNRALGFETPSAYLLIVTGVIVAAVIGFLGPAAPEVAALASQWQWFPAAGAGWVRWPLVLLIAAAAFCAAGWRRPVRQLFALSVIGLGITLYYVLYQAPDLALTQMMVESATLLLALLVVVRLKRDGADLEPLPARGRCTRVVRLGLAGSLGLIMGGGVLLFQQPAALERAGAYYVNHTQALAHGLNAVNTVVVDFRGWDTLLEITVLIIAALGCLGLLYRRRGPRTAETASPPETDLWPVPKDLILRVVALAACVPLNLFALHIFLRGHNAAGGGFIAGLITALSLLILGFVLGLRGLQQRLRVDGLRVAALGVLLAAGTALAPAFFDRPLLNHFHGAIGSVYVGTPMLFDLGVYLAVVGVTLKIMLPLMRSVHGCPAFTATEAGRFRAREGEPIDLVPPREASVGKGERT